MLLILGYGAAPILLTTNLLRKFVLKWHSPLISRRLHVYIRVFYIYFKYIYNFYSNIYTNLIRSSFDNIINNETN